MTQHRLIEGQVARSLPPGTRLQDNWTARLVVGKGQRGNSPFGANAGQLRLYGLLLHRAYRQLLYLRRQESDRFDDRHVDGLSPVRISCRAAGLCVMA